MISQSSTINIFQVIDVNLLKKLSKSLNSNQDLLSEKCFLSLKNQCIRKYPILYERLKVSSTMMLANGKIPVGVKRLYGKIIEFCLSFYENLEVRDQDEEYSKLDKTDIEAEFSHIVRSYTKDHSMLQTTKPVTKMHERNFVPSSSPYTLSLHQVSLLCHAVVLRKKSTDSKK